MAPPFKRAEFDIMYNHGISKEGNVLDVGVREEFVQKTWSLVLPIMKQDLAREEKIPNNFLRG